ncbi:MAG: hypothetical protein JSW58_02830 [Candidatus Latescibacterota bacterium]|nr:MAG: hypothetical protein JSW58_02830 [Candidatus Latescibacterota bacterium]
MPSTKTNSINQYCSVCKDHFEMDVVKQGSSKGVVWLKCPGCQGFLPYMPDESEEPENSRGGDSEQQEIALEDLDIENAKEYSEKNVYEVGEILHHRSWNDFGRVVSKDRLPGNRRTIWVQFLRQGKIQLLEGVE